MLENNMFNFDGLSISHQKSTMKIGTDAVFLAECVRNRLDIFGKVDAALDIGCGCGFVALLCAKYFADAAITAIDIDEPSVEETTENFIRANYIERLHACCDSVLNIATLPENFHHYDVIVSNPPFFIDGIRAESRSKVARHADALSYDDLAFCVGKMLSPSGCFCCILPYENAISLKTKLIDYHIFSNLDIVLYSNDKPLRQVMFFRRMVSSKEFFSIHR